MGMRICRPGQKTRWSVGCHRVRHRDLRRATTTTAMAGGGSAVCVDPVSSLTDCQLGGSGGASLHCRHRRLLASHPSSSTVVSSGRRRLCTMLLRSAFSRWRLAMSFCRLSGARMRLRSRQWLCWVWDFCRPPRRKEDAPPYIAYGGGGGAKPRTVEMCIAQDRLGRGDLLSFLRLSPPPSISLLSTPLLTKTAPQ